MSESGRTIFERKRTQLLRERSSWIPHWEELSQYIAPEHGRFNTTNRNLGGKVRGKIINNTAGLAANTLASGLMSGVTSAARPWFRLTTPDPELAEFGPVKEYLHAVDRRIREVFSRSNLYRALPALYRELGVFGTAAMVVREDADDVIRCYNFTVGEYALGQSHRNVVDTVYRDFSLTVWQAVSQFGLENVSQSVKDLYARGHYHEWVEISHVIEPNEEPLTGLGDPLALDGKPVRSVYYERGAGRENKFLSVAGFDEFPVMAPRWNVVSSDVYGFGPGQQCLGDVKELQHHELLKAEATEKMVRPPMTGPSSLQGKPVSTLPGGLTYVDALHGQQAFTPAYQVNFPIDTTLHAIDELEQRINKTFSVDMFRMISELDRRQITATEINERREEKLLMLGPVLERLNDELLDPLIDRTFAIMHRRGLLPPPPEEVRGANLRVEFISILAQAQKAVGTATIERFMGYVGRLAAVRGDDVSVFDKIDADQSIDDYGDMLGVPPRLIRTDKETAEIRAERARAEQTAQSLDGAQRVAATAKVLAETGTESGSALERVLDTLGIDL